MLKNFVLSLFVLAVSSSGAIAADGVLDESSIVKLYEESAAVATGSLEDNVNWLDKHTDDSFVLRAIVRLQLEGNQVSAEDTTFNKQEAIDAIREQYENTDYDEVKSTVNSVDFLEQGKKARVNETMYMSGSMMLNIMGAMFDAGFSSTTNCNDVVELGEDGVIRLLSSSCDVVSNVNSMEEIK